MVSISKVSMGAWLILFTSCGFQNANIYENRNFQGEDQDLQSFEDIPQSEQKSFFDLAIRNSDYLWNKKKLSVCWENGNDKNGGKLITQQIVTSEFVKLGFNFTGWKTCDSNGANIRIVVGDNFWPGVSAIGNRLNNKINGMSLTFTFDYASPTGWAYRCKTNPNYRDNCIRNYALHEFGHAIGLEHEANRSDSTCSESTNQAVISIGNYDANSIMNYCNNKKYIQNNWKPKLSVMDISEIKKLYSSNSNLGSTGSTGSNVSGELGHNFVKTGSGNNINFSINSLSCPANGDNSGVESANSFNFLNGSVIVKLSLDAGISNHSQYFGVEGPGGNLYIRMFQWGNTYQLKARHNSTDLVHKSYSSGNDKYLKISHEAAYNRVTFSTSSNGASWTPFGQTTFTGTNVMKLIYDCGNTASTIKNVEINNVEKSF